MFNNLSIFNMAEEKTYVFGEGAGNNGILSLLGPIQTSNINVPL